MHLDGVQQLMVILNIDPVGQVGIGHCVNVFGMPTDCADHYRDAVGWVKRRMVHVGSHGVAFREGENGVNVRKVLTALLRLDIIPDGIVGPRAVSRM
jgi:hypothetical protein